MGEIPNEEDRCTLRSSMALMKLLALTQQDTGSDYQPASGSRTQGSSGGVGSVSGNSSQLRILEAEFLEAPQPLGMQNQSADVFV